MTFELMSEIMDGGKNKNQLVGLANVFLTFMLSVYSIIAIIAIIAGVYVFSTYSVSQQSLSPFRSIWK